MIFLSKIAKKIDKFYFEAKPFLAPSDLNRPGGRNSITESIITITIGYRFKAFKQEGFDEFDHTSRIEFQLGLKGYIAKTSNNNFSIEKSYSEQLDDKEINSLVKAEMKAHQEMIENKIMEVKKRKK